jgi:phosphonate transport system ATP-binding protein
MLALQGVTRRFGDTVAVADVDLAIERGSFVGVIGRSGAGKSTLLRMLNRLVDPSAGRIRCGDVDVTGLKGPRAAGVAGPLRHGVPAIQPRRPPRRADERAPRAAGKAPAHRSLLKLWSAEDKAMALSALEQFDMGAHAASRADQLSGGQQQRVAIARALVQEPEIVLADEPIASLDPRNTKVVMDALQHINRQYGITVVCNLHSLEIARGYCDRLVGMSAGRIVFDGTASQLTDSASRDLYGLEAAEPIAAPPRRAPKPVRAPAGMAEAALTA